MADKGDQEQAKQSQRGAAPSLWLILIVALLVWNLIWVLMAGRTAATRIPYTLFLAQVQADNVTSVTISGDQITGRFVKPFALPAQPDAKETPTPSPAFQTTFPEVIGDSALMPLLGAHHVEVTVVPPAGSWIGALVGWLPVLLLFAYLAWSVRRTVGTGLGAFNFGRSNPRRYTADWPKVTFKDVAGADEAKAELEEEVDFLRNPAKYHSVGARIPKGVLLVGAPGTGKTLLARAVAGEAQVPFFSISASEFIEMFVGVGASRVRDLFDQAKKSAPAIVFIDELDAVGRRRGAGVGTVNDEREQTLNQLLGELDGFDPRTNIIVLAATNRPDVLDPALLRAGRFDRQVAIPLPDRAGRAAILQIHTRAIPLAADIDLARLAAATIGMAGADLENLCNEAALSAARHSRTSVAMADFDDALDRLQLGAANRKVLDPEELRVVAYHEAGHTIAAWYTPGADPVQKVTVTPHGMALGATQQLPARERSNLSEAYLKARLIVMLGGRAAEELVLSQATTGAERDLVEATKLARQMVMTWGMGGIGLLAFASDEAQPFLGYELAQNRDYSESTAARIDDSVRILLDDAHEEARRVIDGSRRQLDELVEALRKDETVNAERLATILGPRQSTPVSVLEPAVATSRSHA